MARSNKTLSGCFESTLAIGLLTFLFVQATEKASTPRRSATEIRRDIETLETHKTVWDRVFDPVLPRQRQPSATLPSAQTDRNRPPKKVHFYTFCSVASVAAFINFWALLFGSPLPNTALPATKISAPARTTSPTVSRAMPPSTSIR